ncbi:hypothetical protein ACFT5B_14220 [Luteimicrobium sp. NPDC057192]|uniref:hypothetical protein n=1 Tax=Luteimicrobium sp. NPDC057192 TaxID=3346042 RepID=UPI00363ADAB2
MSTYVVHRPAGDWSTGEKVTHQADAVDVDEGQLTVYMDNDGEPDPVGIYAPGQWTHVERLVEHVAPDPATVVSGDQVVVVTPPSTPVVTPADVARRVGAVRPPMPPRVVHGDVPWWRRPIRDQPQA